jgi:hypothetical protein
LAEPRDPGPEPDERDLFQELYESNFARILGYAMRRGASADDAADVVAETFLVTWRRLEEVPSGEASRAWLYGVARRLMANHRRGVLRQARLAARLALEIAPFELSPPSDGTRRPRGVSSPSIRGQGDIGPHHLGGAQIWRIWRTALRPERSSRRSSRPRDPRALVGPRGSGAPVAVRSVWGWRQLLELFW